MLFLGDDRNAWCVYEHISGICWKVDPDTPANAKREAALVGEGHTAMRLDRARDLANAFNHGRMYGVRRSRLV